MKEPSPFWPSPFPEWRHRVRAAFTTRYFHATGAGTDAKPAGAGADPYADANLGFRSGGDPARVARNWETALEADGLQGKALVIPRMVHGDAMIDADGLPEAEGDPAGSRLRRLEPENADAIFSRSDRRVLAVTMADCLTALIFDPAQGTIAAVHAGWRGTRARILEKSLRALADAGHILAETCLIAFGPCLQRDSLQMGPEVAERLHPDYLTRRDGKTYFDMPACNRDQALACGIPAANIRDAGGCTLTEPERYFSYRRDGPASGRLAAYISLTRA